MRNSWSKSNRNRLCMCEIHPPHKTKYCPKTRVQRKPREQTHVVRMRHLMARFPELVESANAAAMSFEETTEWWKKMVALGFGIPKEMLDK